MKKITLYVHVMMFFLLASWSSVSGQDIWWHRSSESTKKQQIQVQGENETYTLDANVFQKLVQQTSKRTKRNAQAVLVNFPDAKGVVKQFSVLQTEVMHPELAKKYPTIGTYVGVGVDNPTEVIRFSYDKNTGLQGAIITEAGTQMIRPQSATAFTMYAAHAEQHDTEFECHVASFARKKLRTANTKRNADDAKLRRYRLALSVSGDYAGFFLDGTESDDTERRTKVMAAMVATMNRVNGIFERDFGVTMQIIPENDAVIFLDAANDPYAGDLNDALQQTLDSAIGTAAYDVGHLFHHEVSIYGNAGCIACVCTDGEKGSGFTVHSDPGSDHFSMIVAHEFGHQFGGYHVQSSEGCRSGENSEVEPGSGSSIMGYAGICSPDVQENPDDYFNYVDIRDVAIWTINNSNCAEIIDTGNTAPVVDAGNDYVIPASTPFVLEGSATDVDADDVLTYCWEQNDPEDPNSFETPSPTWQFGPLFRSKLPTASPVRYMPALEDVLVGVLTPTWEVLPSVSRTMRFELTVRDNALQAGQSQTDGIDIEVTDTAGPFVVTSPQTAETWKVGEEVAVAWNVANTNLSPVNATEVDILLSVDGGFTYPHVLQEKTANDGEASFILPYVESTTTARIMVRGSDNIFFSLNPINFAIQASDFQFSIGNPNLEVCQPNDLEFTIAYRTFLDFEEEVSLSVLGLPDGMTAQFTPATISGVHETTTPIGVSISGIENVAVGSYEIAVRGIAVSGVEKLMPISVRVFQADIAPVSLELPNNAATDVTMETGFQWSEDVNASSYEIEIATDVAFTNIIEVQRVEENRYQASNIAHSTIYYWRVSSENSCGVVAVSDVYSFTTACTAPENFSDVSVGSSFVELQWEDTVTGEWEIVYGETGFEIENGTTEISTDTSYRVAGLTAATAYEFYVRAVCDIAGKGEWVGPIAVATTQNFCEVGRFYDSGGPDGPYQNFERQVTVIRPENIGDRVRVDFTFFDVEGGYDYLRVYDGPIESAPLIGEFSYDSPGRVVSSHESGSLTFVFISDSIIANNGWEANVVCEPQPNCAAPNNVAVSDVTSASALVSWASNAEIASWDVEYGPVGFVEGNGTMINSTTLNATIPALTPETVYEVYVRGNCAIGGVSDVFGPIRFETLCGAVAAPFTESFLSYTNLGKCWGGDQNQWYFNKDAGYDAESVNDRNVLDNTGYAWVDDSSIGVLSDPRVLITPLVDVAALSVPSVQFSVFSKNTIDAIYNTLVVELYDGAAWNTVLELAENTHVWRDVVVDLSAYTVTGPIQLRFTVVPNVSNESFYNDILIDEIKVDEMPSCINPYALEVTNVRGRSASLSWEVSGDETNWELQYGEIGFSPSSAIAEFVTSPSYELTNLQPETTYELYVRSVCAIGDNSDFVGPITFRTACDALETPFAEDFSSRYGRPSCWEEKGWSDIWEYGEVYDAFTSRYVPDRTLGGGSYYAYFRSDLVFKNALYTPFVNVSTLTTPSVQFSLYSTVSEAKEALTVEFFDGATWHTLHTLETPIQGWQDYYYDVSSYTITGDVQVRFVPKAFEGASFDYFVLVDDVKVQELVDCATPRSVSVADVTDATASVVWESQEAPTTLQIEYGKAGFTLGTGTVLLTGENGVFELTALEPITEYEVYVRTACGNGVFSEYSLPVTFTTLCGAFAAPFEQSFENYGLPICWEAQREAAFSYGSYYDSEKDRYVQDRTLGQHTRYVWQDVNSETSDLYTPFVDVSALTTPAIQFSLYSAFMQNDLYKTVEVSFFDGSDWKSLLTLSDKTEGWRDYAFDISSYAITGPVQVRFEFSYDKNGYTNHAILLDEVRITELPSCMPPQAITVENIGGYSLLSWEALSGETSWEVEYGRVGFIPGTGTKVVATTNQDFQISNLSSMTTYDVYLKADCGSGDYSDYSAVVSFETACLIDEAPYEENFGFSFAIPQCWVEGGDYEWTFGAVYHNEEYLLDREPGEFGSYAYVYDDNSWASGPSILETVFVDVSSLQVPSIQFSLRNNPEITQNRNPFTVEFFDGAGWNLLLDLTAATVEWRDYYFDISSYDITGPVKIRFTYVDNSAIDRGDFVLVDDVKVTEMTTCFTPYAISYEPVSANAVLLSWESQGDAQAWELEYANQFFTPNVGQGTVISADGSKGVLIDGLDTERYYYVYIKSLCGQGDTSNYIGPITVKASGVLGVEEPVIHSEALVLYPNPNNGSFELAYAGNSVIKKIQVFDYTGKLVFEKTLTDFDKKEQIHLNTTQSGMYVMKVTTDQATVNKVFVVE